MGNSGLGLDAFGEDELIEIFSAEWFGMDIDFRQFQLLDDEHRKGDIERFARLNGVRFSILSKIVGALGASAKSVEMKQKLDQAGEIMLVARGGEL